ncbi:hypothetical protein HB943_01955 [Listeria weihenstephanensis]|uniref:Uncharacterized protein n=1 Tax=Listeria weihenstephanensis TaxID=1006155 RepID=A0A841Z271_9LIST|nr:hypothetical protein [Listeria weihenstephanensis]MBC1499350.1 hypothetical protein [Listeria weihenstephanensis]
MDEKQKPTVKSLEIAVGFLTSVVISIISDFEIDNKILFAIVLSAFIILYLIYYIIRLNFWYKREWVLEKKARKDLEINREALKKIIETQRLEKETSLYTVADQKDLIFLLLNYVTLDDLNRIDVIRKLSNIK